MTYTINTLPSAPDQRDIPYVPRTLAGLPASLDLLPDVEEVENQAHYGTCVANGTLTQCEMLANRNGVSVDLSRMFVYANGRSISGLPQSTPGMIPRDALRALYRYGVPPESDWTYTPDHEHAIAPDDVFALASTRTVSRYEAVVVPWLFGGMETLDKINRIKAALAEGLAVGMAMTVTDSLYHLTGPWRTHNYKRMGQAEMIGGHYMTIIGYDDSAGLWLVQNSWGPAWGDGGFCGLPYAIVDEMFFESWLIRGFAGMQVPESEGIKPEIINRYVITARIVPPASRIGEGVYVWIGAKTPDGTVYLRQPGDGDVFAPVVGHDYPPTYTVTLTSNTPVTAVRWRNMEKFAGTKVFVAYGYSPLDWTIAMIGVIPSYL